jgi:hypothetical protein
MSESKLYRFLGVDTAINMLRPGAKWELTNTNFTRWDDPRPQPSWELIEKTMAQIKEFEDSIPTIWLEEDLAKWKQMEETYENKPL